MELVKKGLIVSCQAQEGEPMYHKEQHSLITYLMAKSAIEGGAKGIRAEGFESVKYIKERVSVPVIGLIKKHYPNSTRYITPTIHEVEDLVDAGADIIAIDYTDNNSEFAFNIMESFPETKFMADCSTLEEIKQACQIGFHYVSTTLRAYTKQSKDLQLDVLVRDLRLSNIFDENGTSKLIIEGGVNTPSLFKKYINLDIVYAVVVGSAITRPKFITEEFLKA